MSKFLPSLLLGLITNFSCVFSGAMASDIAINDTARLLAGMPPSEGSSLTPLANSAIWKGYASRLEKTWATLEQHQLSKVRDFAAANLTQTEPTLIYFFSGPDYLYANSFFPSATNYILAGLEPVGEFPDLNKLSQKEFSRELNELERSLNSILKISFFITKNMTSDLAHGQVRGTLPVILLFMARTGATIDDVVFVNLDGKGGLIPAVSTEQMRHSGVKISFRGSDGVARTLYYFSTELSNSGFRTSGLMEFSTSLGASDALIKSASYLLHSNEFSMVRTFLRAKSSSLLQDDTGIPVRHLRVSEWDFKPFGAYLMPISLFPGTYQRDLAMVYRNYPVGSLEFGIGYRWQAMQSNLLLAVKNKKANVVSSDPVAEALEIPPSSKNTSLQKMPSRSRKESDLTFKIFSKNFLPL